MTQECENKKNYFILTPAASANCCFDIAIISLVTYKRHVYGS